MPGSRNSTVPLRPAKLGEAGQKALVLCYLAPIILTGDSAIDNLSIASRIFTTWYGNKKIRVLF